MRIFFFSRFLHMHPMLSYAKFVLRKYGLSHRATANWLGIQIAAGEDFLFPDASRLTPEPA
jgi:hypothetical protein